MLCDGDSKSFNTVSVSKVYGDNVEITKEDCVNHVAKRMGTALRNLKAEAKAQKQPISGKGKLTEDMMIKIQNVHCPPPLVLHHGVFGKGPLPKTRHQVSIKSMLHCPKT